MTENKNFKLQGVIGIYKHYLISLVFFTGNNNFTLQGVIGKGGFANIHLAKRDDGLQMVIKVSFQSIYLIQL